MSETDPAHDTAQAIFVAQKLLGERLVYLARSLCAGTTTEIATGALFQAAAFLITTWAEPGREGALLISASDYFADYAARFPVGKPPQ